MKCIYIKHGSGACEARVTLVSAEELLRCGEEEKWNVKLKKKSCESHASRYMSTISAAFGLKISYRPVRGQWTRAPAHSLFIYFILFYVVCAFEWNLFFSSSSHNTHRVPQRVLCYSFLYNIILLVDWRFINLIFLTSPWRFDDGDFRSVNLYLRSGLRPRVFFLMLNGAKMRPQRESARGDRDVRPIDRYAIWIVLMSVRWWWPNKCTNCRNKRQEKKRV